MRKCPDKQWNKLIVASGAPAGAKKILCSVQKETLHMAESLVGLAYSSSSTTLSALAITFFATSAGTSS